MDTHSLIPHLEAFLFYHGEPASFKKIAAVLGVQERAVVAALKALQEELASQKNQGLMVLIGDNQAQLMTKPELSGIVQKLVTEEFREELSPAALEVLSLIAYLGPVTRPEIDYIRGVNSSFIIRNLLLRGLLERMLELKHGAYQYVISFACVQHLGVPRVEALPEYDKYHSLLTRLHAQEEKNP